MYTDTRAKVIGRDRRRVGVALVSSLRLWAGVGADDITDDVTAGSGLRCLPFEQPSEGTANRPLLTKFKSCKSSQWQSALFIISWNPLSKSIYLNCMTLNVELIASCCIGEEFDRTTLFGFGVELLECFVVVFLRQQAGQSSQTLSEHLAPLLSRISTLDPAYSEPEGNFQPLCDYLENKTAKSRGVLINLSPFHLSRPVIYTDDTFKAWTDLLMYLSFGTVTKNVTTFNK